ncbi:hypothetical protein ACT691_10805 [Vibrio metschnikovii]
MSELELSQQQRLLGLEGLASRVLNQEGQLSPIDTTSFTAKALCRSPSVS